MKLEHLLVIIPVFIVFIGLILADLRSKKDCKKAHEGLDRLFKDTHK